MKEKTPLEKFREQFKKEIKEGQETSYKTAGNHLAYFDVQELEDFIWELDNPKKKEDCEHTFVFITNGYGYEKCTRCGAIE